MKWRSLEESAQENTTRTLREIYSQRKQLIEKYVPADIQAVHARVVEELKHSGVAERTLKRGDAAPQFELQDHNGKLLRSSQLLETGPLGVCFFRGRWCPFCIGQAEAMNAIVPQLRELGASLVGISPQTVHQNFLMADQHKLQFPLLSDAGNHVARQFGLVYRVPEYQREVYKRVFVNLPFVNGDASWELPIPAAYIVWRERHNHEGHEGTRRKTAQNQQTQVETQKRQTPTEQVPQTQSLATGHSQQPGTVIYAGANPDYTDRPEPSDILKCVAQLLS
ncbi:MAG TPA: peroxiredoxin-like family protein [Terriglobales bacterium]|nr:peroxiredoxin-like family protein [Terriglobales bacterium]